MVHCAKSWGWMIVLGASIVWFVMGGNIKSFTIFYLKFKEQYNSDDTTASWIATLNGCLKMMTGPIAAYLCKRFSCRIVVFIGSILSCIGMILTAYPPKKSIYSLYFSYGFIAGFGASMMITPTLIIIPMYFKRKQGLAMALALAGGSFGSLTQAPLFTFILNYSGYTGMMLISAGLMLQCCISAALYRSVRKKKENVDNKVSVLVGVKTDEKCTIKSNGIKQMDIVTLDNGDLDGDELIKRTNNYSFPRSQTLTNINGNDQVILYMQIRDTDVLNKKQELPTNPYNISSKKGPSCLEKFFNQLNKFINFRMLFDYTIFTFCCLMMVTFSTFNVLTTYLGGVCRERGLTDYDISLILSLTSLFEIVSRLLLGITFDNSRIRTIRIPLLGLVGMCFSSVVLSVPYTKSRFSVYLIFMLCSSFGSAFYSQHASILSDLVKIEEAEDAFGIVRFFQGIGIIIGPTVGGRLHDLSGTYTKTFQFAGISMFIMSFVFLITSLILKGKNFKENWNKTGNKTS